VWGRLLSVPDDSNLTVGLRNPIQDPLWLLARQFHTREFQAQDGGVPVSASVQLERLPVQKIGKLGGALQAYDPQVKPLEFEFEGERPEQDLFLCMRLQGHFMDAFTSPDFTDAAKETMRSNLVAAHPFAPTADATPSEFNRTLGYQADSGLSKLFDAGLASVADCEDILRRFIATSSYATTLANEIFPSAANALQKQKVLDGLNSMLQRHPYPEELHRSASLGWNAKNMEYEFSLQAGNTASGTRMDLEALNAGRSHLDWFSFNIRNVAQEQPIGSENPFEIPEVVPAQLYFTGMPSPRWWELEERVINLYDMEILKSNLSAIITRQAVYNFSMDWFLFPVTMASGQLIRVSELHVKDHFGRTFSIKPSLQNPYNTRWTGYQNSVDKSSTYAPESPWLFLTPTVQFFQQSALVEKISFMPDEIANMTWGVELVIPSLLGGGKSGSELADAVKKRLSDQHPDTPTGDVSPLEYRLGTNTPENWVPFLPEKKDHELLLRRGVALRDIPGLALENLPITPRSLLLRQVPLPSDAGVTPMRVSQTAIAPEGTIVSAQYKRCRWYNGETYVWLSRKTSFGKISASSGLTFDNLKRNKT
jgi:hypothetical protein